MFCPDCDTSLDTVPVEVPCPSCGGWRRSAVASSAAIQGSVTVSRPTTVADSALSDGTRETVVNHPGGTSVSSAGGGHDPKQEYEGKPSQGEENVPDALHRLRETLDSIEGSRVWREHVGHPTDISIDGTLSAADGREMTCQVTKVVPRDTKRDQARDGKATSHNATDELAANIVTAVEKKVRRADPSMTLVLDANLAPAYTDDPKVVEIARATLIQRGHLGRWVAIWLVGPTTARTTRIDQSRVTRIMASLRHAGTPLVRAQVDQVPTRNQTIGAPSCGSSCLKRRA